MKTMCAIGLCAGLLAAVLSGPLTSLAYAEAVEVPLPELTGWYYTLSPREVPFSIELDPSRIAKAQIRVKGLILPAPTTCNYFNGANFAATVPASTGEFATPLSYIDVIGSEFAYGWDFKPADGASWQFLAEGGGTIEFLAYPRPLTNGCSYVHDVYGQVEVTYVSLLFELEEQVSTEERSWGQIKALYTR
jgi:hypothetical protein